MSKRECGIVSGFFCCVFCPFFLVGGGFRAVQAPFSGELQVFCFRCVRLCVCVYVSVCVCVYVFVCVCVS